MIPYLEDMVPFIQKFKADIDIHQPHSIEFQTGKQSGLIDRGDLMLQLLDICLAESRSIITNEMCIRDRLKTARSTMKQRRELLPL